MTDDARSYSTNELAKRLGVSLQTVQRWVDSGRLIAWRTPGGHRRIDAQSAELLLAGRQQIFGGENTDGLPRKPIRVVIVDDGLLERELMVSLAQAALPDAQFFVAGNGFQGMIMIAKFAPDVVVADVEMPHMDSVEMIRHVLADIATRPRLLIAITTASPEKQVDGFDQLPSEVLLLKKPFRGGDFLSALESIR